MKGKLILLLPLFCAFMLLASCGQDSEPEYPAEATQVDGQERTRNEMLKEPLWLVEVVKAAGEHYNPFPDGSGYPYPGVYVIEYEGETYIHVLDGLKSMWLAAVRFFTLEGEEILPPLDAGEEAYNNSLYHQLESVDGLWKRCFWSPWKNEVNELNNPF